MKGNHRYLLVGAFAGVMSLLAGCGLFAPDHSGEVTGRSATLVEKQLILVGTYTDKGSEGVYSFTYTPNQQQIRHTGTFITPNPTYLAYDKSKGVVFISNEESSTDKAMVTAASLDGRSGRLTALNSSYTLGVSPSSIATDSRNYVVTANNGSGSLTLFKVDGHGLLGQPDWNIVMDQQEDARPQCVLFSPNNKELFLTDRGLDKVYHFNVSANNPPLTIDTNSMSLPTGTAPICMTLDAKGEYAYLLSGNTPYIYVYRHRDGSLDEVQRYELSVPAHSHGQHLALSGDGKFLYASHSGATNAVSIFKVEPTNGTIREVGQKKVGAMPRHFAISPDGQMLVIACMDSNKIEFYHRDMTTGLLTDAKSLGVSMSRPAYVLWLEQF